MQAVRTASKMITINNVCLFTDDFFLGAGVRSFVVIGQVLDW